MFDEFVSETIPCLRTKGGGDRRHGCLQNQCPFYKKILHFNIISSVEIVNCFGKTKLEEIWKREDESS